MLSRWLKRSNPDSEAQSIAAIYRLHGGLIYRFALRLSQDESIAEEVTQEVFLTLLRPAEKPFDPSRAALSTWLCGIARRLVWKHLDQRQRHVAIDCAGEEAESEWPEDDPGMMLSRKEAVEAVRRGLDELPLHLREVVILCEFEEMKYQDAAEVLGVPVGTVRSRLHRAKSRLALLLAPSSAAKERKR